MEDILIFLLEILPPNNFYNSYDCSRCIYNLIMKG